MFLKRNSPIEIVGTNENIPAAEVVISAPASNDPGLVVYQEGYGTTVVPVFITGGGGGGGTASTFGATFPLLGTAVGALDTNGNMAALNLDSSGNLKVTGGGSGGGNVTIVSPLDGSGYVQVTIENSSIPVTGTFWPYSLGQQLAAASVPVVLTALQTTTLTPPSASAIAAAIVSNPPTTFNGVVTNTGTFAVQDSVAEGYLATLAGGVSSSKYQVQVVSGGVFSHSLNQDGSGNVGVNIENTVAITGTISVTQGTSPWVVSQSSTPWATSDAADAATGANVPTDAIYIGGNKSGKLAGLLVDASGNLEVSIAAQVGDLAINLAQLSGFALGAPTAWGTAPTTSPVVEVLAVNAELFAGQTSLVADVSGFLKVNIAAQSLNPITITGAVTNAGTFAVQEATLDATIVAQGTSASSKILIAGGKSNDATAQYRELPLGGSGRSIIVEGYAGGTAVPISGTVTTQVTQGTRQAVSFTSSTPADTSNTIGLVAYANVAVTLHYSGTVTGGQMFFEVSDDNSNWYGITMAPTDNTQTGAVVINFPVDNYTLSSAASNITWQTFVGGYAYFRVRMHIQVVGSGTAIVAVIPSTAACDLAPQVTQGITPWVTAGVAASGAAVTGNPVLVAGQDGTNARTLLTDTTGQLKVLVEGGTGIPVTNSTAASFKTESILLDGAGTNLGTVKAASTQAATTDTSLVVQLNPEQPALTTALNTSDAANGPVTPGTAASKSELQGGVVATSAAVGTVGQQIAVQMDVAGCIRVNPAGQTGSYTSTHPSNPPVNTALTITVPAGQKWLFKALFFQITSGTSGTTAEVEVLDASGNLLTLIAAGAAQGTSVTDNYTVAPGLPLSAVTPFTIPVPEFALGPGFQIIITATSLTGGDQIKNVSVNYIMYND